MYKYNYLNTPMLSYCDKVLQPIVIARVGTSDIPNLALADRFAYCLSPLKNSNGTYETKYMVPPTAAPVLAVINNRITL